MWPSLAGMDRSPSDGNSSENIGSTPAVPPAGPGGGAAAGEVLATGPAEVLNIEDASPEWDKVQKELPDTNVNSEDREHIPRCDSLPPEINSIYAAIASGIPGAVSEVLGCIRNGQAVDELTARNGRVLLNRRRSVRGSGIVTTGHRPGGSSSGGGGGGGGGALEGKEEQLETLAMLSALSGNVDMFTAVLQAMRQKLPTAQQIASVLEAKDMEGRSLVASAAEGGSLEVVTEVVGVMGGEASVFARMSRKEAGYFVKMAAKSGCIEAFHGATDIMARNGKIDQAMMAAAESDATGASVLAEAASSGSGEMVDAVVIAMLDALKDEAVANTITASGGGWRRTTALVAAAEARNLGAVTAVIRVMFAIVDGSISSSLDGSISSSVDGSISSSGGGGDDDDEEFQEDQDLERRTVFGETVNVSVASRVSLLRLTNSKRQLSRRNRAQLPDAIARRSKNIASMMMSKNARGMTALSCAATNGDLEIMFSVLDVMYKFLSRAQISEACGSSFSKCCVNLPTSVEDAHLEVLSHLLQHGAKPASKAFTRLCNHVSPPLLKERLLGAVSSADNPFIPGMNLSVACTAASIGALEGDKRRLASMQAAVDELLLEILDHLPQTVMGFKNEMKDCSAIFEPETVISSYEGCQGPLSVALTHRGQMETYCTTPLVLDYMSRKFTKGLPGLMDREGVLLNTKNFTEAGQTLYGEGLIAEGRVLLFGMALQRDCGESTLSSITYFPGARFIIAGLLSRPGSYYKVPALRMALDLVTYLTMLTIFGAVILQDGQSVMKSGETIFAAYILGAILTECREIYADPFEYMRDQWNVLDVCSLLPLLIGLCFRAVGGVDDHTTKACYALGAPLVFARILYFAQVLPSQGPMIQVFFSMTGLLVKFGTIMFVVMLGFAMSFYSLFREARSYGQVWQAVFKAMLGETDYFDQLSGTDYDTVATLLLVVFILVITIMMLNLLVAVLSTAHARVDNDADMEFKVTKARLIQRYNHVVGINRLPPPYNLIQWIITVPFRVAEWFYARRARASSIPILRSTTPSSSSSRSSAATSRSVTASSDSASPGNHGPQSLVKAVQGFFGQTVFWLALGPLAVFAGWALWTVSIVKAPVVVWGASQDKSLCGRIARASLAIAVCAVGAPLWLLMIWIRGGFRGFGKATTLVVSRCCSPSTKERSGDQRQRRAETLGRASSAGRKPPDLRAAAYMEVDQEVEDASEKVVTMALKASEGALAVGELQLFLDDPMSDPDVRRDEETRPTTVEHIKLLRNRLEATNKEHMEELRACLERTTGEISRQLEGAGLVGCWGGIGGGAGGSTDDASGGGAHAACEDGRREGFVGKEGPGSPAERPRGIVDERCRQLEDRAEQLTSALEERVVAMIDERLDALARKVDAILAPLSASQDQVD